MDAEAAGLQSQETEGAGHVRESGGSPAHNERDAESGLGSDTAPLREQDVAEGSTIVSSSTSDDARRPALLGHEDVASALVSLQRTRLDITGRDFDGLLRHANSLLTRYDTSGKLQDLADAKAVLLEAIRKYPQETSALSALHNLLLTLQRHSARNGGDPEAQDLAIVDENDLAGVSEESEERDQILSFVSFSHFVRDDQTGGVGSKDSLDDAINLARRLAEKRRRNDELTREIVGFLAMYLTRRFERQHDPADLDEAIRRGSEGLELTPPGHKMRPVVVQDHAMRLNYLSNRDEDVAPVDQAIAMFPEVFEAWPPGHFMHVGAMMNYATCLDTHHKRTSSLESIERAKLIYSELLEAAPTSGPVIPRPLLLLNSGNVLTRYHHKTGDPQSMVDALNHYREAYSLLPEGHPHRAQLKISIVTSEQAIKDMGMELDGPPAGPSTSLQDERQLIRRLDYLEGPHSKKHASHLVEIAKLSWQEWQSTHEPSLLREVIVTLQEAEKLIEKTDPSRFNAIYLLANALRHEYIRTHSATSLTSAISTFQEALELCSESDDALPQILSNLAGCMDDLSHLSGTPDELRAAVSLHRQALQVAPSGHAKHVECVIAFLTSLDHLFERARDVNAQEEAIVLYEQTLAGQDATDVQRLVLTAHLGLAKMNRFAYTMDISAVDDAIRLQRQALEMTENVPEHQQLDPSWLMTNLAIALHIRYEQTDDVSALDESVHLHTIALQAMSPTDPTRSRALMSLGNALLERGRRLDSLASVQEAFAYYEQAMPLRPRGHPGRATLLIYRTSAASWLAQKTNSLLLLPEALANASEAMSLQSPESPMTSVIRGYILNMCHHAFNISGMLPLLAMSVLGLRRLVATTSRTDYRRKEVVFHLCTALQDAFDVVKDPSFLQEAVGHMDELESSTPPNHPLKTEFSLARSRLASTPGTRYWNPQSAITTLLQIIAAPDMTLVARFRHCVRFLREMDNTLAASPADPDDAKTRALMLELFKETVKLIPRYLASLDENSTHQIQELRSLSSMGNAAGLYALTQDRPKIAIHLLETARSAFWSHSLRLRNTSLDNLPPAIQDELRLLFRQLDQGQKQYYFLSFSARDEDDIGETRRQQNARLDQLASEARKRLGFERFLLTPTFSALVSAAKGTLVVFLIAGREHCEAIVVRQRAECTRIPLPGITEVRLKGLADRLRTVIPIARGAAPQEIHNALEELDLNSSASQTSPDVDVLCEIWENVVKPILLALDIAKASGRSRRRLHWCPTGAFNVVPLHAAGDYRSNDQVGCSDYVVSSYTPTLSALLDAKRGLAAIPKTSVKAVLIGEANAPGMPRLSSVDRELDAIERILETNGIASVRAARLVEGATIDKAAHKMQDAAFVHLACHGAGHAEPLQGGFALRDGRLTVRKLAALRLANAFFAFMSACESPKVVAGDPEQAVHLSAVMLGAGFRSVIGTMWSMHDEDGPLVAERVYSELCKNEMIHADDIPYALDAAVQELRQQGLPPSRWAPFVHFGA